MDLLTRLANSRLYLVCDARPGGREPELLLEAALSGGVDVVQLRDKRLSDRELLEVAVRFHTLCKRFGALFILNDRPDLVPDCGADGVHVGQDDATIAAARELVGSERLVGLSTHTPEQVEQAQTSGADYIAVGPVHETPTKPGRPAVGPELVRYAAQCSQLPFFAIGGIDPTNVGKVRAAGADRVAVVRAITQAGDPAEATLALRPGFDG